METLGQPSSDHAADHARHRTMSRDAGKPRTLTRSNILDGVAGACPALSRSQTREVMETVLEEVASTLIEGEPVRFRGFGQFTVREKRERVGRNPRTGVEAPIAPRRVMTFKPSAVLVEQVNAAGPKSADRPAHADRRSS